MFKTETHLHTAPVSACGKMSPEEMIRRYAEAGYTTVFVSDHFAPYHFDKLGDGTWGEKVDMLCDAYEKALEEGKKHSMNVLFSPELSLCGNHYLLYGMDREFLKAHSEFFSLPREKMYALVKDHGGYVIQAHPFRDGKCFPTPDSADGFEVMNLNPRHENYTDKCIELAKGEKKPMSAGSDAHREEDIGLAAMLSEEPIVSWEQYIELLFGGKLELFGNGAVVNV